jgi:elongation factor 2
MAKKEDVVKKAIAGMRNPKNIRNIGIVAHVDHGKTTLSDNLIAAAGLLAENLAGKQCALDFWDVEQQRGITVNAANITVTYYHPENKEDYIINLIDTPGHVDFAAEVTRAMRAVDGIILVVCGVEGVKTQTEKNLIQALKEGVKPVLFINKIDRLLTELKVPPEEMMNRFIKIITDVNKIIQKYAPEPFKDEWLISPEKGNVAFGSAYNNWAISVPMMKRTGITFKDVYSAIERDDVEFLKKNLPLVHTTLDMVINQLPDPITAQKYRIPIIWKGDINSEIGQKLLNCDPNGPLVMMITKIIYDPHAGFLATGRIFSGRVKQGTKVYLSNAGKQATIQQVSIMMGADRVIVDDIPAGNIVTLGGLKEAAVGDTVSTVEIDPPFEAIKHYSEPVITAAFEPKNPTELHKLINALRILAKEDSSVVVNINEETGECLVSAMGSLHLEIILEKLKDLGVEAKMSPPVVVYRETVLKESPVVEGKSPNRHNRFYVKVEPLEEDVYNAIIEGKIPEGRPKDPKELGKELVKYGIDSDQAKRVWSIKGNCLFVDQTKGVQYLHETKELILQAFEELVDQGPLAKERMTKMKVLLTDATLHEDSVHRGPAQILPAVKKPIYAAILQADPVLLEPKQKVYIDTPDEFLGAVLNVVNGKRGKVIDVVQEGEVTQVISEIPVSEMMSFEKDIRSAAQGKPMWSIEFAGYDLLPRELQQQVIREIRIRKGLPEEPPKPEDFMEM